MNVPGDWASWLSGKERNVSSQFGEDGLIAAALSRIGITNRWCFEVGANDGLFYSNTKALRDAGWNAILIEAEATHYAQLQQFATEHVHCLHAKVGAERPLDDILASYGAPHDLDFGVIDVDGQDYWIWSAMMTYVPRLMLVEFCPKSGDIIPDMGDMSGRQATLSPILALGKTKGYHAVAQTQVNVVFVRNDLI